MRTTDTTPDNYHPDDALLLSHGDSVYELSKQQDNPRPGGTGDPRSPSEQSTAEAAYEAPPAIAVWPAGGRRAVSAVVRQGELAANDGTIAAPPHVCSSEALRPSSPAARPAFRILPARLRACL